MLCPEIMQIYFSLANLTNYYHTYITTKKLESYFIKKILLSCYYWHRLTPLPKFWKTKKRFWNILPIIEKIPKWTPKNQKFQNLSTTHEPYFIWAQKILLLELWAMWGSKLKVQVMDSYPVNKCIYNTYTRNLKIIICRIAEQREQLEDMLIRDKERYTKEDNQIINRMREQGIR